MGIVDCEIIKLPPYRGIGLRWEGPYKEVSELKKLIYTMTDRINELPHALKQEIQLGLSYHLRPDGFVHYSVYEVEEQQQVPDGMVEINVPSHTYLRTFHQKGANIGQTYEKLYRWILESDYIPFEDPSLTYYDVLPIKHERYPLDRDLNDPHFEVLIPIQKRSC